MTCGMISSSCEGYLRLRLCLGPSHRLPGIFGRYPHPAVVALQFWKNRRCGVRRSDSGEPDHRGALPMLLRPLERTLVNRHCLSHVPVLDLRIRITQHAIDYVCDLSVVEH